MDLRVSLPFVLIVSACICYGSYRVLALGHSVSVAVAYIFYIYLLQSLVSVSSVVVLMTLSRLLSLLYSMDFSAPTKGGGVFLLLTSVGFLVLSE